MTRIVEENGWGGIVSSGIHDWRPRRWPSNPEVSEDLRKWLAGEAHELFYALDADLRGADLTGGDLTGAWLTGSNFTETVLREAVLIDTECTEARFTRADLSNANLAKSSADRANFVGSTLTSANLAKISAMGANFHGANLSDATLSASLLAEADFSEANLARCRLGSSSLCNAVLSHTALDGATGKILGPVVVETSPRRITLDGAELERWFRSRGADIIVQRADHENTAEDSSTPSGYLQILAPTFQPLVTASTAIHVDLPHSQVNQWFRQLGRGPGQAVEVDVRNVPSAQALAHAISPGSSTLTEAISQVPAKALLLTKVEQLGVKNRPALTELLHAPPAALAARKANNAPIHIGLVDLSSAKADIVLAELQNAPAEGIDEPVTVYDYPAMP